MYPNTNGTTPFDNYGDLDNYGKDAVPERAFALSTETLAAGDYDCEFGLCMIENRAGHRVCSATIIILSQDRKQLEHTFWLNKQTSVDSFLADMLALGFAAKTWGSGPGKVPLSQAIPACVARLPGIRFRATKTVRPVPAQPAKPGVPARDPTTFHDFVITGGLSPVTATPVHQPMPSQSTMMAPPPNPGVPVTAGVSDEIPF